MSYFLPFTAPSVAATFYLHVENRYIYFPLNFEQDPAGDGEEFDSFVDSQKWESYSVVKIHVLYRRFFSLCIFSRLDSPELGPLHFPRQLPDGHHYIV